MPIRYNGQDNRLVCGNTPIKSVIVGGQTCVYGENVQDKYIYTYSIENDTVTITGLTDYGKTLSKLSIPESIEGKLVTSIEEDIVSSVANSLYIPSTIESMRGSFGDNPFKLEQLSSVMVDVDNPTYHSAGNCVIETATKKLITGCNTSIIPDDGSVTSIGDGAFFECNNLTSIAIPDGVKSIGGAAFRGCSKLTSIIIPDSVTRIDSLAFFNTPWYNSQPDGVVYAGKVAYEYKGTMPSDTSIVLQEGTLGIAEAAFDYQRSLTSITIPNTVTTIADRAFVGCTGLTSIVIPNSVEQIGASVLSGCTALSSVVISNSLTEIPNSICRQCTNLISVDIPENVTSIGNYAFNLSGLQSITIKSSVVKLGTYAFGYANDLTSAVFEDTNGWQVSRVESFNNYKELTSSDLSNSNTAATYLKTTYADWYWRKV